jgi:hypothetical protein
MLGLVSPLQNDDGDLPRRLLFVLLERRHTRRLQVVEAAALGALGNRRLRLESFRPDLDGHARVREEVPIPIGIGGCAAFGCDHEKAPPSRVNASGSCEPAGIRTLDQEIKSLLLYR